VSAIAIASLYVFLEEGPRLIRRIGCIISMDQSYDWIETVKEGPKNIAAQDGNITTTTSEDLSMEGYCLKLIISTIRLRLGDF
jgi:hypothetical protein